MTRRSLRAHASAFTLATFSMCLSAAEPARAADDAPPAGAAKPAAVAKPVAAPQAAPAAKPAPTLKVGDPAPKLSLSKWVKGEPVTAFEKDKVYVVEFWATWCGPCKTSIPHVTKLQKQYKDKGLVVVGVDIWEPDTAKVAPFVEQMGEKMDYAVAIEEPIVLAAGEPKPAGMPRGRMAVDWMAAAGQNGIPCSFIVDKAGMIAWVGHPMTMDRPLAKILDGTFDAKAEAEFTAKVEGLNKDAAKAAQDKDWDKALQLRDDIAKLDPTQADMQRSMKLMLLMQKGDAEAANALAADLTATAEKNKDGMLAARTASMLLNGTAADKSDKATALKAATLAYDLGDKSLVYTRLLAQALAANKQYDKAVELQTKVVAEVKGPLKTREEKSLEEYKEAAAKKVD